ncbi:hypothetical protein [Parafilimonas terrae]|uniref:Uncharacterized protein n=1 Tax=Parafilimonas terrae TaxID=1465490 RepID=A0A1I5WIP7_9BACT|nr:hypothetical protein [Parafilimonas terrae]SFQ19549.1 hypothetical protein SAMN05444277_106215 [Parafilimonas terrae]
MPDNKIDQQGYAAVNADEERDLAAKGGPASGLGIPDDKHGIKHPYDEDTQTQLAALSTKNKKDQSCESKNKS